MARRTTPPRARPLRALAAAAMVAAAPGCSPRAIAGADAAADAGTDAAADADAGADAGRDAIVARWERLDDPAAPSARTTHVGAFDPARGEAVFYGGFDGRPLDEVWAFETGRRAWRRLEPAGTAPAPRHLSSMIADPARDRMVVFQGWGFPGSYDEVWALELGPPRWVRLPSGPSPRFDVAAATDGARAWTFGGYTAMRAAPETVVDELWAFDLATDTWTQLPRAGPWPAGRTVTSFAYHDGALYLSGGHDWTQIFRDAWRYDLASGRWEQLATEGARPLWAHNAVAVDTACGALWLAGGDNDDLPRVPYAGRVLLAGGVSASEELGGSAPTPRRHVPMVFDPARRLLVLHGGDGPRGEYLSDTWVYAVPPCGGGP